MSVVEELEKLNNLRESGTISDEEYEKLKDSIMAKAEPTGQKFRQAVDGFASDTKMWGMFIHLSQLCSYLVPLAGLVVPIVLWQIKKDESEIIDRHGRIVANWLITKAILCVVFFALCFVVVGFPLIVALAVVSIIFPIIGGVKANNGEVWRYPLSIKFFSEE